MEMTTNLLVSVINAEELVTMRIRWRAVKSYAFEPLTI
jgi:hypothetical protein